MKRVRVFFQAPLEIILELCRELRREKEMEIVEAQAVTGEENVEPPAPAVRMEIAKILVISHDISLTYTHRVKVNVKSTVLCKRA